MWDIRFHGKNREPGSRCNRTLRDGILPCLGKKKWKVCAMNPIQLTKLLSDEQKLMILSSTFRVPKSINDLSTTLGIPLTACYRRTKELEKAGLIEQTERVLTKEGKRVSLYRSNLKSAYLTFEDGRMRSYLEISGIGTVEDTRQYNNLIS